MERHYKIMRAYFKKPLLLLTILLLIATTGGALYAQVFPKEGSKLHYRIIGFSAIAATKESNYKLEIAAGTYFNEDSFKNNIIVSQSSKTNKIIAEVPSFGAKYTWRVTATNNIGGARNTLYHFSTGIIPFVDTAISRLRITTKAEQYTDGYVFLDGKRTLYDMNGHPVWYLPALPEFKELQLRDVRDLKMSPMGTITFLADQKAYEINYNGDVLWKGPNTGAVSGQISEHYHHEFTRLANGHYMVLGDENVLWKLPASKDSSLLHNDKIVWDKQNNTINQKITFGTVIEYDDQGHVIWSWKSSDYFKTSDLGNRKLKNGMYDIDTHENSFFYDEHEKVIYVSFRNISRVVKIKYPEGTVLNTYGNLYKPGAAMKDDGLFCYQHSCGLSQSGYLYLFNNNSCKIAAAPTVLMMQEPLNDKEKLQKIWEYDCNSAVKAEKKQADNKYTTGGNVIALPDNSLFVSMCSGYSDLFIVNKDKKILWDAIPEKWDHDTHTWAGSTQYRASIIPTSSEFQKMVWAGQ